MPDLLLKDVLFILVFAIVNSTKLLSVTLQDLALFNYYVLLVIYMCFQYVLWFNFAQVVVLVSCSFALLAVSTTVLAGWHLKWTLSSDGGGHTALQPQP